MTITQVSVGSLGIDRLGEVLGRGDGDEFLVHAARARERLGGRVVWNVNSTARGGGVAELLRSLLAYARGGGVDARWVAMGGDPEFFGITKRLHNRLHGATGDGGGLGAPERAAYERTLASTADELLPLVAPGDLVIVHDPQPAGLCQPLIDAGAHVIWRCHVGLDRPDATVREAWDFLRPYVTPAAAYVFSRKAFVWSDLDEDRVEVIPPSIDAFSPKNQDLSDEAVNAILSVTGLRPDGDRAAALFTREDGAPARVDRVANIVESIPVPDGAPMVLQVSRWDRLKDPLGVIQGFVEHVPRDTGAHLVYAGPDVAGVADDPEGADVLAEATQLWEGLASADRDRVHLACLPMVDGEENAAIVNALQRQAAVVVQKSLAEGFGLTVAEAMWKGRPVVASRIGGIQDQIEEGESGLLVDDPTDLAAYGAAVTRVLQDPALADRLGQGARQRVGDRFLASHSLLRYIDLFDRLMG